MERSDKKKVFVPSNVIQLEKLLKFLKAKDALRSVHYFLRS